MYKNDCVFSLKTNHGRSWVCIKDEVRDAVNIQIEVKATISSKNC